MAGTFFEPGRQFLWSQRAMVIGSVDDYRIGCKGRLPRFPYDYISGGSHHENTLRANIADLQATLLRQRVMVDELHLNLSISLCEQPLSPSIILGPVGMAAAAGPSFKHGFDRRPTADSYSFEQVSPSLSILDGQT